VTVNAAAALRTTPRYGRRFSRKSLA
jgi:hypothetical protein